MATRDDIVKLYVGYFNRAPDPEGLNYWLGEIADGSMTLAEIAESFSVQSEATELYPFLRFPEIVSPEAFVTQVYLNLFNREPDDEGLEYWTDQLSSGASTVGGAIVDIISGAQNTDAGQDLTTLENKAEAANNWTVAFATAGLEFFTSDADGNLTPIPSAQAAAKDVISDVDETPESVDDANQKTMDFVNGVDMSDGSIFFLGTGSYNPVTGELTARDNIVGTSGNDTVFGEPGDLITGDRIDGGGGLDELIVVEDNDFSDSTSPVTTNVEHFVVTMQEREFGNGGDNNIDSVGVAFDAGRMSGVTRWEDYDSRADLVIEDARDDTPEDGTFTAEMTVAMVSTDPGNVDYAVYFDDPVNTGQNEDVIFVRAIDQDNSDVFDPNDVDPNDSTDGSLLAALLSEFKFFYEDTEYRVSLQDEFVEIVDGVPGLKPDSPLLVGPGSSYAELLRAVEIAIENQLPEEVAADLVVDFEGTFQAVVGTNNDQQGIEEFVYGPQIAIRSLSGAELVEPGFAGIEVIGFGNQDTDVFGSITGEQDFIEDCIRVDIVLDDVGKSSAGGDLVVGAMSTGTQDGDPRKSDSIGIQCFDIYVDRESNLQTINSTNNSLEEVMIMSRDNGTARGDSNDIAGRDDLQSGDLIVRGGTVPEFNTFWNSNSVINNNNNNPMPGAAPQHNIFGFSDVRTIDASTLNGALDASAELTDEIVEKYLDLQDTAQDQDDDNVDFDYQMSANDDEFTINLSAEALTAAGTGSREDFEFNVSGRGGDDWITTNVGDMVKIIDAQGQDWFGMSHGFGDVANALTSSTTDQDDDDVPDWYENHNGDDTSTLTVQGGSGNDAIWTYGYGDYSINAGADDDVIYSDNSGVNWLAYELGLPGPNVNPVIDRPVTAQDDIADNIRGDHYQIDYAVNAVWTFNDDNGDDGFVSNIQGTTNDVIEGAREEIELRDWFVTVSFNTTTNGAATDTAYTSTVELSIGDDDVIDDAIMNQAIKDAILGDRVLNNVLEVQDGPGQSLLVWSKIDGDADITDLSVSLYELNENSEPATTTDYDVSDFQQFGEDSDALTNSSLTGAGGDDTIVMSSSKEVETDPNTGREYNADQVVNFGTDFGTDTVFHFDQADDDGANDELNFSAGSWVDVIQVAGNGGLGSTDRGIDIIARNAGNDTTAELANQYDGTADDDVFLAIVYQDNDEGIIDNANNIGDVYLIDGGSTASADYLGSVELIGVDWSTLDNDDFFNVA